MTDLIITSLLPLAERLERERMLKRTRRRNFSMAPIQKLIPLLPKTQRNKNKIPAVLQKPLIKIESEARFIWSNDYQDVSNLLDIDEATGASEQMPGSLGRERELVMGIDFGTSSVKLVIGDKGASKAYAVPFIESVGIDKYLLPSRVFEENGNFSLSIGSKIHRDLKLKFLADPSSKIMQATLVGFMSLIIRRCRAWLFKTHADILMQRTILWKLVLGRAIDYVKNDPVERIMSDLLNAAWIVAGEKGNICRDKCAQVLNSCREEKIEFSEFLEVSIVPELAAQIYGFVKSRQFDPRAKNFYLFIDVGAGTVDVSLFRVKLNELGAWDFSLFTSIVQPNGVINLHRYRMDWWQKELINLKNIKNDAILNNIANTYISTEQTLKIPKEYLGYFKGIQIINTGAFKTPDDLFFDKKFVTQVRGQAIHRTVLSKIVGRIDLEQLPFFLSGGGSRFALYRNISSVLNGADDFRWLKAQRRELGVPDELVAPGLPHADYDRLSVAFGLSFIDVGFVVSAKAMPSIKQKSTVNWKSAYVDKDAC